MDGYTPLHKAQQRVPLGKLASFLGSCRRGLARQLGLLEAWL